MNAAQQAQCAISAVQVITSMSLAEVQVYSAAAASDPEAPLQWLDAGSEGLAPSADDGIRRACLPFSLQVPLCDCYAGLCQTDYDADSLVLLQFSPRPRPFYTPPDTYTSFS